MCFSVVWHWFNRDECRGSKQPTCEHDPHESVSQEGVVNEAPQPAEVGEEVVHRVRAGFQQQANPRPQLGYGARERARDTKGERKGERKGGEREIRSY